MSIVQPSLFPIDHQPVSERAPAESPRHSRSFSTFLESLSAKRPSLPQDHSLSSSPRDRRIHEGVRADRPERPAPLRASRRSPSAASLRAEPSREAHEQTGTSSRSDHLSAETQEKRRSATERAEDASKTEQDEPAAREQAAEKDDTDGSQSADMMIGLCVCLAEPVAVNGELQPSSGGANALVITIESASARVTFGIATDQPIEPIGQPLTESSMEQSPLDSGEVKSGHNPGGEPKPAFMVAPLVSAGDQTGATQSGTPLEAELAMDPAALASGMPADGEALPVNEPLRVSSGASLASEAAAENRNAANGIDTWQQGDHPATDLMVEQRALPEWSQFGGGHDEGMGERDDRAAGGGTESPRPGQHLAPREGFGDTVAAMAADRTAQMEGNTSRTVTSSAAGRAASSWPEGDDRFPMVQTVNLNLEPADLGPVNVRIFMSDRTVHAHITTGHMDFGQGMLSQQQQLETRLQSSGLEMGEFKVTVDHQQLSRGNSQGWLGHQGDRRPSTVDSIQRTPERETPEAPTVERRRHSGIVSLFA